MNKGYTYIDGKVVISDEFGNHKITEYTDNLDKILVQENLVETIKNDINILTKKSKKYKNKKRLPTYTYTALIFSLLAPTILISILTGQSPTNFSPNLINISLTMTALACLFEVPIGIICDIDKFNNIKKKKGLENNIDYLKSRLKKELEVLESLKETTTYEKKETEDYSKRVNDLETLKQLRNDLKLYYNLGVKEKKYYNYYKKGKLDKKIEKEYDTDSVTLANEYFEDKGPVLSKKKH